MRVAQSLETLQVYVVRRGRYWIASARPVPSEAEGCAVSIRSLPARPVLSLLKDPQSCAPVSGCGGTPARSSATAASLPAPGCAPSRPAGFSSRRGAACGLWIGESGSSRNSPSPCLLVSLSPSICPNLVRVGSCPGSVGPVAKTTSLCYTLRRQNAARRSNTCSCASGPAGKYVAAR
jgi:hypothetical protein